MKFANNDKNMFAYSSMSGSLFICEINPVPKVLHRLDKHDEGVSGKCIHDRNLSQNI